MTTTTRRNPLAAAAEPLALASDGGAALDTPLTYDYSQVAEEHRSEVMLSARRIKLNAERTRQSMIAVGKELISVKDKLPHGHWLPWLKQEFDMSDRTAQRFMSVADTFDGKYDTVSFLSDSAQVLLSGPTVPETARVAVLAEAQQTGKSPTKARVQEVINSHKPAARAIYTGTSTGKCEVCRRPLTDPDHIRDGCGPVCAEKRRRADTPPPPAKVVYVEPEQAFAESYIQREPTEAEQRRKRAQELIDLWRAALNSLPECGELTGHFSHDPVRRAVAPILEALEANL